MQTHLADFIKHTDDGKAAEAILRNCVHCGFCTATCPTYQLLGDELDGPRGRIYLIKAMLEGNPVTEKTQQHLDRCLTCRSCETTCPSGVRYGRLVEIGRKVVAEHVERSAGQSLKRWAIEATLSRPSRFKSAVELGRLLKPVLPSRLKNLIPERVDPKSWPAPRHGRRMITLGGCAQPALAPHFNAAAARVLDRLGISLLAPVTDRCCGAVSHHENAEQRAQLIMRDNVVHWHDLLDDGVEALVITASACALQVKEYAELLADDREYAAKAARVSAATKDVSEVLEAEDLSVLASVGHGTRVAFHSPCTLQHGLKRSGAVESLLSSLGFELTPVSDAHLCCGSAGTYALHQPELSRALRENKLKALNTGKPDVIATANIGCHNHLRTAKVPVVHWIEMLDTVAKSD